MKHFTVTKTNEIMPFAAIWMDLKIIIVSEVSQTKRYMRQIICRI